MENQTAALSYDNMNTMPALYVRGPSGRYKLARTDLIYGLVDPRVKYQ